VKALDDAKNAGMTANASLTGTPLYMSPEAIQSPLAVDNRSDLYAVGAVGYFLLTGQPVFSATSIVELCKHHVDTAPVPPSQRSGRAISSDLEDVILSCLEKNRARRPQTARDLSMMLLRCVDANQWAMDDADGWWTRHERGLSAAQVNATPAPAQLARSMNGPSTPQPFSSSGNAAAAASSAIGKPDPSRLDQTMISGEFE